MVKYAAQMEYSVDTVTKLAEMQHKTFHGKERLIMLASSVLLLLVGFQVGIQSITGIIFCFAGCVLFTGINARPRATAKELIAQIDNQFPTMKYTFTDQGFSSQYENEQTPYSSIIRLVDDGKYGFLYVSTDKAYMIDMSTVHAQKNAPDFKTYLSVKTNQEWTKSVSYLNIIFKN